MFNLSTIEKVGTIDLSKCGSFQYAFDSSSLTTIKKLIPPPVAIGAGVFGSALANITIEGTFTMSANFQVCPLSHDSIVSIINALSDSVTSKTLTLKESAVNNAFRSDDQFTIANTEIMPETGELIDGNYCHNIPCVLSLG